MPLPSAPGVRLPASLRWTVFARSFLLQAGFNPKALQGLGWAWSIRPALERLHPAGPARVASLRRHLGTFNTHPYFSALLLGAVLRLEERASDGEVPDSLPVSLRDSLAPSLAAIGDDFFWNALRPACVLVALLAAPSLGPWSALLFVALYNGVHLAVRAWLFDLGYRRAEALVPDLARAQFPLGTVLLKRAAAALAGAVAAQSLLLAQRQGGALSAAITGGAVLLAVALAGRVSAGLLAAGTLAAGLAAGLFS